MDEYSGLLFYVESLFIHLTNKNNCPYSLNIPAKLLKAMHLWTSNFNRYIIISMKG